MKRSLLLASLLSILSTAAFAQAALPDWMINFNVYAFRNRQFDHNLNLTNLDQGYGQSAYAYTNKQYDSFTLSQNAVVIETGTWNAGNSSYDISNPSGFHYASEGAATSGLLGNYQIHAVSGANTYDFSFDLNSISMPLITHDVMITDLGALMTNATNTITWYSGIPAPEYTGTFWGNPGTFGSQSPVANNGIGPYNVTTPSPMDPHGYLYIGTWSSQKLSLPFDVSVVSNPDSYSLNFSSSAQSNEFVWVNEGSTTPPVGKVFGTPPASPVPEPSTYGLLGAGALAGLVAFRRRAVHKAA